MSTVENAPGGAGQTEKTGRALLTKLVEFALVITVGVVASMLCLATLAPLPVAGWSEDTSIGHALAGQFGRTLFTVLAMLALLYGILAMRISPLLFCMPLVLFEMHRPETLSLNDGVLNSFMEIEAVTSAAMAEVSSEEVREVLAALRDGASASALAEADEVPLTVGWGVPLSTYAITARMAQWRETGAVQAEAVARNPREAEGQIAPLQERHLNLQMEEIHWYNCIESVRGDEIFRDRNFGGSIFNRFNRPNCGSKPDNSQAIAAVNAEIAAIEAAMGRNAGQDALAEGYAAELLAQKALYAAAQVRRALWDQTWAFALGLGAIVALAALLLPQGHLVPAVAVVVSGICVVFGPDSLGALAQDPAGWQFVALHGVFLLALFLSVRILRLFVLQNRDMWSLLSWGDLIGLTLLAVAWWSLLGFFTLLGFWGNVEMTKALDRIAYIVPLTTQVADLNRAQEGWLCQNPEQRLIFPASPAARQLEADIDYSVGCHFQDVQAAVQATGVADEVTNDLASAGTAAARGFDRVVPGHLPCQAGGANHSGNCVTEAFNYPDCDWLQLICKVKRIPHRMAERAYADKRAEMRASFVARVTTIAEDISTGVQGAETAIKPALSEAVLQMGLETRRGLATGFRYWDVINAVGAVLFAMAVVKSFGYVLARLVFDRVARDGLVLPPRPNLLASDKAEFASEESRTVHRPGRYYMRAGGIVSNVAPTWPWLWRPWAMPFARLPRLIFLARFSLVEGDDPVVIARAKTSEFAKINLEPGEAVSIAMPRLFAFSSTVGLRRVWTFHLSHLIQGRASMAVVSGPGTVYLRSRDKIEDGRSKSARSFAPTRLLAWDAGQRFVVRGRVTPETMYMGGVTLSGEEDVLALYDSHSGGAAATGALRFIPLLLMPI
jgi:hypothetical protein